MIRFVKEERFGWAGPNEMKAAEDRGEMDGIPLAGPRVWGAGEPSRTVFWEYELSLLGQYLPNIAQEIGDCVSWGVKNARDRLSLWELGRLGDTDRFRPSFAPYDYGCMRVLVGGGRLRGDGALGAWGAESAKRYGFIPFDYPGVPAYSGRVASAWGRDGAPDLLVAVGRNHPCMVVERCRVAQDVVEAICGGYPVTIASMRGFAMQTVQRDGKSWFSGRDTWPHQMSILGFDVKPEWCYLRMNSWGPDAHGPQLDGPQGSGWDTIENLDKEMRSGDVEVYRYADLQGFRDDGGPLDYLTI